MPRQKQFDTEETLEKAMNLFWEYGYHQTSIQRLVEELGINRASLYDTFGGKKNLFHLSIEKYLQGNPKEGFLSFILSHDEVKTGIKSLIKSLIDDSEQDKKIRGCFLTNSSLEMLPHDNRTGILIKKNQRDIEEALKISLEIAKEKGEIKPGIACDYGVAIHFINEKLEKIVASRKNKHAYQYEMKWMLKEMVFEPTHL